MHIVIKRSICFVMKIPSSYIVYISVSIIIYTGNSVKLSPVSPHIGLKIWVITVNPGINNGYNYSLVACFVTPCSRSPNICSRSSSTVPSASNRP